MFRYFHKIIFLFLFILVMAAGVVVAQAENGRANSIEPGSWSIQFKIDENFQLTSFSGSAISIKRHWSEKRAVRAGISFGANVRDYDSDYTRPDTMYTRTTETNGESMSASAHYLIYPAPDKDVLLYLGAGPSFSYTRDKNTYTSLDRYDYSRTWSVGLGSVIGVEWFATRTISLLAEYTGGINYSSNISERRSETGYKTEHSRKNISASSSGVRFGLSAYF